MERKIFFSRYVQKISKMLLIKSPIMKSFFKSKSFGISISNLLSAIKVMIIVYVLEILGSSFSNKISLLKPIIALILTTSMVVLLFITMTLHDADRLHSMSVIIVISGIMYTVLLSNDTTTLLEVNYTPLITIIIVMFALCELGFTLPLLLGIVCVITFVTATNLRTSYVIPDTTQSKFETENNQSNLPQETFYESIKATKNKIIIGQIVLLFLTILVGLYLSMLYAFLRKSVYNNIIRAHRYEKKSKTWRNIQNMWIEAVMPKIALPTFLLNQFYFETLDHVAILASEINGLDRVIMNHTALELIKILNTIIFSFEELAIDHSAEKVVSFNNIFDFIIWEPYPVCNRVVNAVIMSTAMIDVVKTFNRNNDEDVNIKIAVHYGKVNAAVIGSCRRTFNIFSFDFIITEKLRSLSLPKKIRITKNVYKEIEAHCNVSPASAFSVQLEEMTGIAGMSLKTEVIETYYVVSTNFFPSTKESLSYVSGRRLGSNYRSKKGSFRSSVSMDGNSLTSEIDYYPVEQRFNRIYINRKKEIELMKVLQNDSHNLLRDIGNPPLNASMLNYIDSEVEWHYNSHTFSLPMILSDNHDLLVLLLDCLVNVIFATIFLLLVFFLCDVKASRVILPLIFYFTAIVILFLIGFFLKFHLKLHLEASLLYIFHPFTLLLTRVYFSSLATLMVFGLFYKLYPDDYSSIVIQFSLFIFSFVQHILFTGPHSIVRQIVTAVLLTVSFLWVIHNPQFDEFDDFYGVECFKDLLEYDEGNDFRMESIILPQFLLLMILITFVTRCSEKSSRTHFLISRENKIRKEEGERVANMSRTVLINMFPEFILFPYKTLNNLKLDEIQFSKHADNAGILFANIGNFFSDYYRENNKQGEEAIKVLHRVICIFDHLLERLCYMNVEKIKSFGSWFIVAVNINESLMNINSNVPLVELMNFGMEIRKCLKIFNEENLIGTSGFELQIGYNIGSVFSAVVGRKGPTFDIWGWDVTLTKYLAEKAKAYSILVTKGVQNKLKESFYFEFNSIFIFDGMKTLTYEAFSIK